MRTIEAYADLLKMGRPVITTGEAAARMRTSGSNTSRRLKYLADIGLIQRIRQGLWALDTEVEPFAIAPYLTAPDPAYVSMFSALARHEMIEQIPRQISIVSLDRTRRIATSVGVFTVHHLVPELFGGFAGTASSGYVAKAEKALFDTVYIRAAAGSVAYFPELSIPLEFDLKKLGAWTRRIHGQRLRTMVSRRLDEVLKQAGRDSFP